jgi:DUF1680 family protein
MADLETPAAVAPETPAAPDPPRPPQPERPRALSRRQAIATVAGAGALVAEAAYLNIGNPAAAPPAVASTLPPAGSYILGPTGYVPDGAAGRTAAFPLTHVRLLDGPFKDNQARNTSYLLFLDPERMLHTFRLNYGVTSKAQPIGGWEKPTSEIRGHTVGHLLSGLAITYANTGNQQSKKTAEYIVSQLAALQKRAVPAGFHPGYLSAFPESFFDRLESGHPVWSPYYMIHKYLAGLIDAYQLAGVTQALDTATRLADWVDWRTSRLSYDQMQRVLNVEYGGLPESLANLYAITGQTKYLQAAQRFYHASFYNPLAAGDDNLAGLHANTNTPKVVAAVRMWEETGNTIYRDIAENFWRIVIDHHTYAIGGSSNHEHWTAPDQVASQLSNYTCEGCVTYNLLKLTRLLHFHQPQDTTGLDYYERALFNQMLGTQDPTTPHGYNCYYTGLESQALKQQPLNYFPTGNPDIYATDYNTFTCDTATGMETQAKFADTIYSRDDHGVYVNLFIPSEVTCDDQGVAFRQTTNFPDDARTTITVTRGAAPMVLRVRVPAWVTGAPKITLNGISVNNCIKNNWITVERYWRANDQLVVTFPMGLTRTATPDDPTVQAITYGPVVLAGAYGTTGNSGTTGSTTMPTLDTSTITRASGTRATAVADGTPVTLLPVARVQHQHFTVYWRCLPERAKTVTTPPASATPPAGPPGHLRTG